MSRLIRESHNLNSKESTKKKCWRNCQNYDHDSEPKTLMEKLNFYDRWNVEVTGFNTFFFQDKPPKAKIEKKNPTRITSKKTQKSSTHVNLAASESIAIS